MAQRHLGKAFFFCDEHPLNYLQKGCLNSPKYPVLIYAPPWSSLSMHAKFGAARFHGFGFIVEMDGRNDERTQTDIYYYR